MRTILVAIGILAALGVAAELILPMPSWLATWPLWVMALCLVTGLRRRPARKLRVLR